MTAIKVNKYQAIGMNAETGLVLSGVEHLKQSIQQIVTTRVGTRVMRRNFGSSVPDLIDYPTNQYSVMSFYAAIAQALKQFEPRFRLTRVYAQLDNNIKNGRALFTVEGDYLGEKISLSDIAL